MRGENARLGVETTMRSDRIARSATEPRSNWLIDQRHPARRNRKALEKVQQGGPRIGSSSAGQSAVLSSGAEVGSVAPCKPSNRRCYRPRGYETRASRIHPLRVYLMRDTQIQACAISGPRTPASSCDRKYGCRLYIRKPHSTLAPAAGK